MDSIKKFARKKSPWLFTYETGGCNGCAIELVDSLTPRHDAERFGALLKGSPRHADIFLVCGALSRQSKPRLERLYSQMPSPKKVIAVGTCACSGGIFHNCYSVHGGTDKAIPVDVYIPGCPPRPEAIIDGILKALEVKKGK